jgi:hypothetical protein
VNTVMNLQVPYTVARFMSDRRNGGFSRRTLLRVVR